MTDELKEAIEYLKERVAKLKKWKEDGDLTEAIDTVVAELEKPTYTAEDMEEFSHWYNRKVSVIGESELHLFGARPFQDIIDYWEQERRIK